MNDLQCSLHGLRAFERLSLALLIDAQWRYARVTSAGRLRCLGSPAAARTTRVRVTNAAEIERERAFEVSCERASSLNISCAFGHPHGHADISRFVDIGMLREHRSVNNGTEH